MTTDHNPWPPETETVAVLFGNSDNKLTQTDWAHFCASMRHTVERYAFQMHFSGGSDWDAPWQNACMVAVVELGWKYDKLLDELRSTRESFKQDSVAVLCGETRHV